MGGIEVIDPRYLELYRRAEEVLAADPRVRSVSPGGSVAAGNADRWSDLDLAVVTEPDRHEEFLADWPNWLARITLTVFARTPIAPTILNTITDQGLTLDIVVWSGEAPAYQPPTGYPVGFAGRLPELRDALDYAVAEQLRGLAGPFITLVQREEHLKHLAGVPHLIGLLTTVFLAELDAPPPGKLWNDTFTEEQRAVAAALPAAQATRDGMINFTLGTARVIIERSRPLFQRYGLDWPGELAAVAAGRVRDVIGVETSDWLY